MTPGRQRLSRYEITGYVLIVAGIVILVFGTVKFNLMQAAMQEHTAQSGTLFGEYGEFIGGIVGSLWALAGVFLFFATLTYQKKEFELQRFELHKTQKIFQQQNFSTLYISFLNKHNDIINALTAYDINKSPRTGSSFFAFFQEKVLSSYLEKVRDLEPADKTEEKLWQLFREYFTYHFAVYENSLEPYLKNLNILFRLIQRYREETADTGEYYSFIAKASFTQPELFLIYHVAKFNLLPQFAVIDENFNVFENMEDAYKAAYYVEQKLNSGDLGQKYR